MSQAASLSDDWKKNPLVWMLIAIPASAVVMGFIMLTLAIQSDSGLVIDDYYKHGKQINRVIARDKAAFERAIAADLEFDMDHGTVAIQFTPSSILAANETVRLNLIHATIPGLDQSVELKLDGIHHMVGQLQTSPPGQGRWNLQLESDQWRIIGSIHMPASSQSILTPNFNG